MTSWSYVTKQGRPRRLQWFVLWFLTANHLLGLELGCQDSSQTHFFCWCCRCLKNYQRLKNNAQNCNHSSGAGTDTLKSNLRQSRKVHMSCITSETELIIYECVVCCKRRMKDSFSASSSATALGRRKEGSYEVHFDLCPVKSPVLCTCVYFTQATTFWTISLDFM